MKRPFLKATTIFLETFLKKLAATVKKILELLMRNMQKTNSMFSMERLLSKFKHLMFPVKILTRYLGESEQNDSKSHMKK